MKQGEKIGEWVLIHEYGRDNFGIMRWVCRCSCGNVKNVDEPRLKNGKSTRCIQCAAKATAGQRYFDKEGYKNVKDNINKFSDSIMALIDALEKQNKGDAWCAIKDIMKTYKKLKGGEK